MTLQQKLALPKACKPKQKRRKKTRKKNKK